MIKISNITKKYNPKKSNEFEALHGVSCEINDGELVAVIGKSGAGKSTLLHILACIDNYQEGEYTIDGTLVKNLSEKQYAKIRNEKIGMVMQDFALVEDFTALENVMIPLNFSKQKIKNKKEDFSDICGQNAVKRAAEIAVAGGHNLLMAGPPGSGKSMIARRIATILPELSLEESLEITRIYSVLGMIDKEQPLITRRPFRSVHHTITKTALVGGGMTPRPGEISMAHGGV